MPLCSSVHDAMRLHVVSPLQQEKKNILALPLFFFPFSLLLSVTKKQALFSSQKISYSTRHIEFLDTYMEH